MIGPTLTLFPCADRRHKRHGIQCFVREVQCDVPRGDLYIAKAVCKAEARKCVEVGEIVFRLVSHSLPKQVENAG